MKTNSSYEIRVRLADVITSGLKAWFEQQVLVGMHNIPAEDSAQYVCCQMIQSTGRFLPQPSMLPPNWGGSQRRVDIAILGNNSKIGEDHPPANHWYGAAEVKWLGGNTPTTLGRRHVIRDIIRLSAIKTYNIGAKFLIIGAIKDNWDSVFETKGFAKTETARKIFHGLLPTDVGSSGGRKFSIKEIDDAFPHLNDQLPDCARHPANTKLSTACLSIKNTSITTFFNKTVEARFGVWQCNRSTGRREKPH